MLIISTRVFNLYSSPMVVMTRKDMQVGVAHAASQEAYSLMRKGKPNVYSMSPFNT